MPELNGKKLYLMYRIAFAIEMDDAIADWEELELGVRRAWERVAEDLETKVVNIPDETILTCVCRSYYERTGQHAEQCPLYQPICTCAAGHIGIGGGVDTNCPFHGARAS